MNMNLNENMRYWVDQLTEKVDSAHPKNEIIVSSGISPSGPYHVGHAREILTAEALVRGLRERGRKVRHLHFVDAFDALRKRYPYLPEKYEEEAGKPLFLIPAPDAKSESYADQYFSEYEAAAHKLGIEMEVIWTHKEYEAGNFTDLIRKSLEKRDEIAEVLFRVSGRTVDNDWQPIQILDETNNSLRTAQYIGFDSQTGIVHYLGSDSNEHSADISKGQVKLDWRCDWPARWALYGVQAEGFGREHATKGGSYDTGVAIVQEIYGALAPLPVPYENINLKGETKKMSSSLGNLVTIAEVLEIIPSEVLRYFTFKSRPERQLLFDPALGLYNLIDEYAKTESETLLGNDPEFKRAWQISLLKGDQHVISTVPFSHLVSSYQTAQADEKIVFDILKRTGHADAVKLQSGAITRELVYVDHWLKNYAPDDVKFSVISKPSIECSQKQRGYLNLFQNKLIDLDFQAEAIHQTIYETATEIDLPAKEAFQLIYQLFIGKNAGPRLGFFLSSLGKKFVLERIKEFSN